ncbi:PilZ domain-containing protein [Paenibacillus sp. GCM10012307]|uniref:PilZ domain-containing protein n=1 Tax=Paenibacillus roseus TaxID=2798579 RepID=A0A934J5K8_9BACL|nr:PilZ domain-containing protein [Paenibacillus roseus]MBJ6360748.1 PilZ domain-containing protein [Paenibacillus roseus]
MPTNQRKEPFRYTLKEPIALEIYILSVNGTPAPAKPIPAELFDISRYGCQISLPLSLQVNSNEIRIRMNLILAEDPIILEGTLCWDRKQDSQWFYGVNLGTKADDQERFNKEMRVLAGQGRIVVK